MRFLLYIAILLSYFHVAASHLVGGEVTYKHLSQNKYQVNVTLYRDCSDCKLGNQGGGNSTSNCSDLKEAYIRTISGPCLNKNIGKLSLTKTGYENITKICNPENSKCGSISTYNYGIEAHHYTGTIDFDDYKSYSGCSFHIFIAKSERNSSITTFISEEDDLYTYAYINPWNESVSSPKFANSPRVIYNHNQPVFLNDGVTKQAGDSIVYKLGTPYRAHNSPILYSGNYSKNQFISTYCPNGVSCSPNKELNPPQGLYFDRVTGDAVFTPSDDNEISTRVVEVEQWRKSGNAMYLAGVVRRDILVIISSSNGNSNPIINAEDEYNLCVGQDFSETITYQDLNPITGAASGDSVSVLVESSLNGISISSIQTNIAPYLETTLSITPSAADIGTHIITFRIIDNHCSEYGETFKTVVLNINPKPITSLNIAEEFCGNNVLNISSERNLELDLQVSSENQILFDNKIISPFIYQSHSDDLLKYKITYTDNLGCTDSITQNKVNIGSSNVAKATLQGDLKYCFGDSAQLNLTHPSYSITEAEWQQSGTTFNGINFNDTARPGLLSYTYTLSNDNYTCELEDSIRLVINYGPRIVLDQSPSFCHTNELVLDDINITPRNGRWLLHEQELASKILNLSQLVENHDTMIRLKYSVSEAGFSCISSMQVGIQILETPELEMTDQQVCGDLDEYLLINTVLRPFNKYNANLTWNSLNRNEFFIDSPKNAIDIENGGQGIYYYECTNQLNNGCISKDTTSITVNPNLELSYNGQSTFCQSEESIKLPEYFGVNINGGIWQIKDEFSFSGDEYTPSTCENVTFQYFYHKNGCHSDIEIPISTVCKPTFSVSLPDEVCSDYAEIQLQEDFQWTLNDQKINSFLPSLLELGVHSIVAEIEKDQCLFDSTLRTEIINPLSFSIQTVPDFICEGEELKLELQTNSKARFEGIFCDNEKINSVNQISYTPKECDLSVNQIKGTINSHYNSFCPSHSLSVDIPYHSKPSMSYEKGLMGCEPFDLSTVLSDNKNNNTSVEFLLASDHSNLRGNSTLLEFQNLAHGTYGLTLNLRDNFGCENNQLVPNFLQVFEKPQTDFSMENKERLSLSERELILFNYSTLESGDILSSWYYGKGNQNTLFSTSHNPSFKMPADTGLFTITLVSNSSYDCKDTATSQVLLVPDIIAFIPSAFTPDNKGPRENSTFKVSSDHASSFYMDIFNKWGQKVFHSTNIEEAWDGTYKGKYCQNGVYLYSIQLVNESGVEYTYQGTVNLIR